MLSQDSLWVVGKWELFSYDCRTFVRSTKYYVSPVKRITLGILMLPISLNLPPHSYTYIWYPCMIWLDSDSPYLPRQLQEKT